MATVDAATGANIAGWANGSHATPRSNWPLGGIVYDLGVYGNNLFVSGAEHYWEQRDATTGRAIRVNSSPHDTQRIEVIGDRVYIGCHCFNTSRALQVIEVSGTTGAKLRDLGNSLVGGDGAWAFAKAPDGCLWTGGDFRQTTQLVGSAGTSWVGRFARQCDSAGPLPHSVPSLTPPPAPADPNVLIARGAEWRYLADGTHPAGWTAAAFADGGWPTGSVELGYGDGGEATVIARNGLSALFRRTFEADPAAAPYLELRLSSRRRRDGVDQRPGRGGREHALGRGHAHDPGRLAHLGCPGVGLHDLPAAVQRLVHTGTNTIAVSVHQSDSLQRRPELRPVADPHHDRGGDHAAAEHLAAHGPAAARGDADRADHPGRHVEVPGRRFEPGHGVAHPHLQRRGLGRRARPASASRSAVRPRSPAAAVARLRRTSAGRSRWPTPAGTRS